MNKLILLSTSIVALSGISLSANAAPQSAYFVSPQQIDALHVGASANEIVAQLGQAEFKPKWPDGTYSLVYETSPIEGFEPAQLFVDIDAASGKVIRVNVIDDQ